MKGLTKWVVVLLLLVQLFGLSVVAVLAGPETRDTYDATLSAEEIQARLGLSDEVQILSDGETSRLIRLCRTIGVHLVRNSDGTLSLPLNDPRQVGVDHAFLRNYQRSLQGINRLIKMGWLTVDDQFNLNPGPALPTSASAIEQGLKQIETQAGDQDAGVRPDGAQPTLDTSRGFVFSLHTRRQHVPYLYASLGPTFASYFGYGRFGPRFSLLFGLNRFFLDNTFAHGGRIFINPGVLYYRPYGFNPIYYYVYDSYHGGRWIYARLWY